MYLSEEILLMNVYVIANERDRYTRDTSRI
jgi:hypothetical protein